MKVFKSTQVSEYVLSNDVESFGIISVWYSVGLVMVVIVKTAAYPLTIEVNAEHWLRLTLPFTF